MPNIIPTTPTSSGAGVEYFLGTIVEIVDRALYQVKVDIPGEFDEVLAFPVRGEIDEPKVGDFVLLRSFDPIYHSYFLYQKLKENDFIGFRTMGKMIDVDPKGEFIRISTFDPEEEFTDGEQGKKYLPEPLDWVKIDKDGNMDLYLRSNTTAKIDGDGEIEVGGKVTINVTKDCVIKTTGGGNVTIESSGNCDIKATGSCTIDSPDVKITGASCTVAGTPAPEGRGAFCGIPACLFTGAPHSSTKSVGN